MQSLLQTVWISHLVGGLLSVTWADRTGVATSTTSNVHVRIAPFVIGKLEKNPRRAMATRNAHVLGVTPAWLLLRKCQVLGGLSSVSTCSWKSSGGAGEANQISGAARPLRYVMIDW